MTDPICNRPITPSDLRIDLRLCLHQMIVCERDPRLAVVGRALVARLERLRGELERVEGGEAPR